MAIIHQLVRDPENPITARKLAMARAAAEAITVTIPEKRGRGRPRSATKLSAAEKQQAYRDRKRMLSDGAI